MTKSGMKPQNPSATVDHIVSCRKEEEVEGDEEEKVTTRISRSNKERWKMLGKMKSKKENTLSLHS